MKFETARFLEGGTTADEIFEKWTHQLSLRQQLLDKQAKWQKEIADAFCNALDCDLVGSDDWMDKVGLLRTRIESAIPRLLQQVDERLSAVESEALAILARERARLSEMYNRSVQPIVDREADKLIDILGGDLKPDVKLGLARARAKEILLARGDIPVFPIIPVDARKGPIAELRAVLQLQRDFEQQLR